MPGTDYQTLSNPYKSYAWNRLSNTKHRILISCLEETIRHYATPSNLMHRIDFQTLSNPY